MRIALHIRELSLKGLPSLLGVRGHRTGSAHSQQIIQSGGDHSGERGLKIVSHLHRFAQTDGKFLSAAEVLTSGTGPLSERSVLASQRLSTEDVSCSLREPCFRHPLAQPGPQLTGQPRYKGHQTLSRIIHFLLMTTNIKSGSWWRRGGAGDTHTHSHTPGGNLD